MLIVALIIRGRNRWCQQENHRLIRTDANPTHLSRLSRDKCHDSYGTLVPEEKF